MPMIVNGHPCETKYTLRLYVSADDDEMVSRVHTTQFTMSTGDPLVVEIHTVEQGKWVSAETCYADVFYEPVHDLGNGPLVVTWEASDPVMINWDGKPWLDMSRLC